MCQNRFAQRSESAVMEVRRFVGGTPQFAGQELAIPFKKLRGSRESLHIEQLPIGIFWSGTDIVQFEVRVRGNVKHAISVGAESRLRKLVARQVDGEGRRLARPQVAWR